MSAKLLNSKKTLIVVISVIVLVIVLIAAAIILPNVISSEKNEPTVITVSTLEKIVNISELSTYTSVYNGVATVYDEKNADEIDYYVSYKAKVKAGMDVSKVTIDMDSETHIIRIGIPEIYITETPIDGTSLEYIFVDKNANKSTVSASALKACEKDVEDESKSQAAIIDCAYTSAKNILTALIKPIVDQLDGDYTLVIE